jgi:Na+/H+-dicarboxylate symporter
MACFAAIAAFSLAPALTSPPLSLALRAALGLVLGLAAGLLLATTDNPLLLAVSGAIEPLGTVWVNGLRMTVLPLVVALLVAGVASTGDMRVVGRTGGRAFLLFVALLSGTAAVMALVAPVAFRALRVDPEAAAAMRGEGLATAAELPSFTTWLTGLVPANAVRAAADGAMLPLIVFSIACGLALTRAEPRARVPLLHAARLVADAMLVLVRWVLALAPIGVFALSLTLGRRMGLSAAGAIGYYIGVHSLLLAAVAAALYPIAVFGGRVSLGRFARACFPAQAVAASSRSSLAALPAMIAGAERTLALPPSIVSFALPLTVSTFKLNQAVSWVVGAAFISVLYGVPLPAGQLATLAATSVAMSFAVPGIPSGGVLLVTPFFIAAGLPAEGVGLLIAADTIPDLFKTSLNVTGQMTVVTVLARGAHETDETLDGNERVGTAQERTSNA